MLDQNIVLREATFFQIFSLSITSNQEIMQRQMLHVYSHIQNLDIKIEYGEDIKTEGGGGCGEEQV